MRREINKKKENDVKKITLGDKLLIEATAQNDYKKSPPGLAKLVKPGRQFPLLQ